MPPQLRQGLVVNHRKQVLPPVKQFCNCYECKTTWSADPKSGNLVRGCYISTPEYKRHRAAENRRVVASARAVEAGVCTAPPSLTFASPPSLSSFQTVLPPINKLPSLNNPNQTSPLDQSNSNSDTQPNESDSSTSHNDVSTPSVASGSKPYRRKPQSRSRSGQTQVDFTFSKLRAIQSTFRINRVSDMVDNQPQTPLVFAIPPVHSSIPLDQLQGRNAEMWCRLDDAALANSNLIGHQEWLLGARGFIDEQVRSDRGQTRALAKVLLRHAVSEQAEARKAIQREWERQRLEAVTAGPNVVNTGVVLSNVQYISTHNFSRPLYVKALCQF